MSEILIEQLSQLPNKMLATFIAQLQGVDKNLDHRIELLISYKDPKELIKSLKKRIQSLKRSSRFIHYRESFDFAHNIDLLLDDIKQFALPVSSKEAFNLIDQFILTANHTFNRVDDSSGTIGECYRVSVNLWLDFALKWKEDDKRCSVNWLERIESLFKQNDYGVYDRLIPRSDILLTKEQLMQLALGFEKQARQSIKDQQENSKDYNFEAATACIGLESAAEALKNIQLYELATLLRSPEPNCLQKEHLAKFSLSINEPKSALKWLTEKWDSRTENSRLRLLDDCYQHLNDKKKLKEIRQQYYESCRNFESLKKLIEVTSESEHQKLIGKAICDAKQLDNIISAIDMLISLEKIEDAEHLLVSNSNKLNGIFYDSVTKLAKIFEKENKPLASALCYRALLDSILERGYTKAYKYGAKYFKKLQILDEQISDYKGKPNIQEYTNIIKLNHKLKRSFWSLIE